MIFRVVSFTTCQFVAGVAGWYLLPTGHLPLIAFLCALGGGYAWLVLDTLRAAKLLRWLQQGNVASDALGGGMWGEVSDRVRRLVRAKDRVASDSDDRLQDLLAALQASPNGVVLLEAQGRIEWFNATAAAHFGFDPARDRLQHFGNLVRDPGFAAYFSAGDFSGDVVMSGRDSTSSKPVKISVHLHPYGAGRSLLLSHDITALEQADAMRRDFVANVSHEIRTPLTVLAGFVETLQYLPLNDQERQRYLGLMSQQAQRMQSLVSDLLMLSRLEGSPLPNAQEWVSAKALLKQCEQDARDLASVLWTRSQDVTFDIEGECDVAGSASELLSAMSNLIGNAIRYTPADQFIGVQWKLLPNGAALFSVQDSGPGIAPEHIGRLTERFYRVDRSRSRDTGGTGLGLAIVKHVAQRHSAELLIESTPGKGSTFSIMFPEQRIRQTSTELLLTD
jgi:two-component system, OmpR family, phosphate regulon sensor histidine kinase PhoR